MEILKIITENGATDGIKAEINGNKIYVTGNDVGIKNIILSFENNISENALILGDHWERAYGDLEWKKIDETRILPWYCLINDGKIKGYGVKTRPNSFCSWKVKKDAVILNIDLKNGSDGTILNGRKLECCEIVEFEYDGDPFDAAIGFCKMMCTDGIFPKEPVYGGNDWYCNYGDSSAEKILNLAKRVAKWSEGNKNRPFMVIDDGWELNFRLEDCFNPGPWTKTNKKFPDMAKLVKDINALDVRAGIWFRPLLTKEELPEECFTSKYVLDPSHPDVIAKIKGDVKHINNLGFELIKHDFSTFDIFGQWGMEMGEEMTKTKTVLFDRTRTNAEIIKDMYAAIREAAGDMYIIGCNTVSHLSAGYFEIQRTGDDTSGKEWARTLKMGVNTLAFRMPQNNVFYACDADCVGITNMVPWKKNKQWLELLSKSGTPLFVSVAGDVDNEEINDAITEAFCYASKSLPQGIPLDWEKNLTPKKWILSGEETEFNW